MTKKNPQAYQDVIPIWRAALTIPSLRLTFPTEGKAVYVLQRCYIYRRALINHQESIQEVPGFYGSTPYDRYSIRREGCSLVFYETSVPPHTATDAEGNLIDITNLPDDLPF